MYAHMRSYDLGTAARTPAGIPSNPAVAVR